MHVAFSARDTMLPNPWLYMKFAALIIVIFSVFEVLKNASGNRKLVNAYNRRLPG